MKLLKSFFIVMLLVSANAASAQTSTEPQWRDLANVNEVISRIARGNEQANYEPLKGFAETLHNMAMNLSKDVPTQYKQKAASIKKLQKLSASLSASAAAKASNSTLIEIFNDVQKTYNEIAVSNK